MINCLLFDINWQLFDDWFVNEETPTNDYNRPLFMSLLWMHSKSRSTDKLDKLARMQAGKVNAWQSRNDRSVLMSPN